MAKTTKRGLTQPKIYLGWEFSRIIEPLTICKHKEYSCEICGTSDEKDKIHTTHKGEGKVAKLMKKKK